MIARSVLVRAQCTRLQWRSHSPRPNGAPYASRHPPGESHAAVIISTHLNKYTRTSYIRHQQPRFDFQKNHNTCSPASIIHGNDVRFGPVSRCAFHPKTRHRKVNGSPNCYNIALTAFALTTPSDRND